MLWYNVSVSIKDVSVTLVLTAHIIQILVGAERERGRGLE